MRTPPCTLLTALAFLSMVIGECSAQPTAAVPVGSMTYPVTTGTTSSFGVPLLELPTFTGIASTVTSNTIGATDANWTPDQFINGPAQYFVAIKTGAQAGRTLLVTGNTANTLSLDIGDTGLDAAGFSVAATTDTFELFQGDTLGTLFGSTADAGGFLPSGLKGGTTRNSSDNVQLYEGTGLVTYFFNTTVGNWVRAGSGTTSQNGLILYPDDGMLIVRRGPTADLSFLGRVPSTRLLTNFPGGTTSVVALRFPKDTTLGGLNFGAPGTWIAGANSTVADTVGIWSGSKWDAYYKNLSNQWIKVNGNSSDQSATVIPAGSSIRIVKRGTATGAAAYLGQVLPYGLGY